MGIIGGVRRMRRLIDVDDRINLELTGNQERRKLMEILLLASNLFFGSIIVFTFVLCGLGALAINQDGAGCFMLLLAALILLSAMG